MSWICLIILSREISLIFSCWFISFFHSFSHPFGLKFSFGKLQSFSAKSRKFVCLKNKYAKSKSRSWSFNCVILELPECLRVKMCKVISSSSITISHSHLSAPPWLFPFPLFSFPPRGGRDNAKRAWVECNNFFEDVAISRGGVSDSYPVFFLLIATTSNKNFKSAETVNVKFGVYEFGDKGQ